MSESDNGQHAPPPSTSPATEEVHERHQTPELDALFKERALSDPGYAIAWAILQLADASWGQARATDALGLNETGGSDEPGTTTVIALELGRIAEALEQRLAPTDPEDGDGHDRGEQTRRSQGRSS